MEQTDFTPPQAVIGKVEKELAAYNGRRTATQDEIRRRKQMYLAAAGLGGLATFFVASLLFPRTGWFSEVYFACLGITVALLFTANQHAKKPGSELQQSFRDQLFPFLFHFVDDLQYRNGTAPDSFERLPGAAVGRFNSQGFGDVVSGRHTGFPFEIYEARLSNVSRGRDTSRNRSTTAFKGVILYFTLDRPFPGMLMAANSSGGVARFFRDLFSFAGAIRVQSGDPRFDADYEFRSDNPLAAQPLITGDFVAALDRLRESWPEEAGRVVIQQHEVFVLLPHEDGFFELPDLAETIDYQRHIAPIAAELAALLTTARLVRQALTA